MSEDQTNRYAPPPGWPPTPPVDPAYPPPAWPPVTSGYAAPPYPTGPAATGSSRGWTALLAVAAVIVLVAGGGWWAFRSGAHQPSASTGVPAGLSPATRGSGSTAGLTVGPAQLAGGIVVDKDLATRILRRYWPVHENALTDRNLGQLAAMSTGPARSWEQASVSCGCLTVDAPRPLVATQMFVPRQTHYPAYFIAEAETEDNYSYDAMLLVFTKHAASDPWLVAIDSTFPLGLEPTKLTEVSPIPTSGAYDAPVSPAERQQARSLSPRLAAIWTEAKVTGHVTNPDGFDLNDSQTYQRLSGLELNPESQVQPNGLHGRWTFYASPKDPTYVVRATLGEELVCQPIRETVVWQASPGQAIYQPPDQHNWGPYLPPGQYSQVVDHDAWQTCYLLPPAHSTIQIQIYDQALGGTATTAGAGPTT